MYMDKDTESSKVSGVAVGFEGENLSTEEIFEIYLLVDIWAQSKAD